jgi:transcriptional regulator of NAD metabolism
MFHTPKRVINHLYRIINVQIMYKIMPKKDIHVKVSEKRQAKLKAYAQIKEKTITQLIEDWIDRLPVPEGLEVSVPPTSRRGTPP